MNAEAAASQPAAGSRSSGTVNAFGHRGTINEARASVFRRWSSSHRMGLSVLLLLLLQQQSVTAIVCEIDARDGLEAATASAAAAAADRQQLLHMLPLCRVPYLVNSQLPPKDVPHVGMERGGRCFCCCCCCC